MNPPCFLIRPPSIRVVYVWVPEDLKCHAYAQRFTDTYCRFRPKTPHKLTIVYNQPDPMGIGSRIFKPIKEAAIFTRDNAGKDIGAFLEIAGYTPEDMLVCFCAHAYFRRLGWLERLVDCWVKYGPGMYGSLANYEVRPHLNTTGFGCSPFILNQYPVPMVNDSDRYYSEHGQGSIWRWFLAAGLPVKLVTWDGEYDWPDWRRARNGYQDGDQTNCLTYFRHSDLHDAADKGEKEKRQSRGNTLTDPEFLMFKNNHSIDATEASRQLFHDNWNVTF